MPSASAWLRVRRLMARLIRVGRDPAMPPSVARYVVLSNIVALVGAGFSLGFAPILFVSGHALYPALQVVSALLYLPTLWLNHRGHRIAATSYLVLASHGLALAQVLIEGRGFDVQLFFLLHAILPFLLFPPRHDRLMFAMAALAGIDLIAVVALGDRLPQLGPAIAPDRLDVLRPILVGGLFATFAACAHYARRATLIAEDAFDRAHQRSEELLLNILPSAVAARLKHDGGTIAEGHADVTVLFADLVGFTSLSARLSPERIVSILNELFCRFDDLAGHHGLEKIKTIGDCYMAAGGLPEPRPDHAEAVADMALAIVGIVDEFQDRFGESLQIRIGVHSGPVVAGVIGKRKFIYDMWGDTVNTASRMESHGVPGAIQISDDTRRRLDGRFQLTSRGTIEIKGKGAMATWLLVGRQVEP